MERGPYLFETRLKRETPIAGVVPIISRGGFPPPTNPTLRLLLVTYALRYILAE